MKDIMDRLQPLLNEGWYVREDGKYCVKEIGPASENPWIYGNITFSCKLWHRVFFELASQEKMVHSHCHDCFKVVAMPKTLKDLEKIRAWQDETQHEAKCGIEIRDTTPRLYGAYWYNRGLEAGLARWKEVEEWASENIPYTKVILKRGCTEFELAIGPSHEWKITEEQKMLEKIIDDHVDYDSFKPFPQHENIVKHIRAWWIKWAYAHGDETYKDFTGGLPIHPSMTTYHDLVDEPEVEDE